MVRSCSLPDCDRSHYAHGLCKLHGRRLARTGTTDAAVRTLPFVERFWAKVDKNGPVSILRPDLGSCWLWTASISGGYAHIGREGSVCRAHLVAYELVIGPVPEGLDLDHLCFVRRCVNPSHLEPVTRSVNQRRAAAIRDLFGSEGALRLALS